MMNSAETWALLGGTLGASLLGSLHCAGMCGPLALMACGGQAAPPRLTSITAAGRPINAPSAGSALLSQVAYHASRGVAYLAVGAAAGALGSLAGVAEALAGTQRVAMIAAGLTLCVVGAGILWTWCARPLRLPTAPKAMRHALARWHARVLSLPPTRRAMMLGFSAPLLTCGWLWAFVAIAATTGSMATGAACMAAFWLGTVPALLGVVVGARVALTRLHASAAARWVRPAMGVALVALGLHFTITRARVANAVMGAAVTTASRAHASDALADTDSQVPACCRSPGAADASNSERPPR